MSLDMQALPEFQQHQMAFSGFIRDPDKAPLPEGMEGRRMRLYAELFYNNIEGQLSTNFPVLRQITPDERWSALVRDFMVRHRCHTPLFSEVGQEFLAFLQEKRTDHPADPAFMLELAHYEWVELALYIAEDDVDLNHVDRNGDLMSNVPVVSELAWPLAYQFDVHHIGPDYQPETAPEQPSYLVVYRDRQDAIGFMEINAVTYRLLELLDGEAGQTGAQLAQIIAQEMRHPDPQLVMDGARITLNELREKEIIVGSRSHQ